MFVPCGNFRFFREIQITLFCQTESKEALNVKMYPLCCFKSEMCKLNSSLCKLNVQIAGKSFLILSNFWCFNSFILSAIAAVKKEKTETNFKSSVGPSYPISEIATSHVCTLKRLETKVIKNHVCQHQESEGTMSYILGVKWLSGCSEVGNHEIYQK